MSIGTGFQLGTEMAGVWVWLWGASGRRPWALGEDKQGHRDGLKGVCVCGDGLRCVLRSELVGGLGDWSWLGMVFLGSGGQVRRKQGKGFNLAHWG